MFQGITVLALGQRDAVRLCANLLEQAGAKLEYAEHRPVAVQEEYDVLIVSSDQLSPAMHRELAAIKSTGNTLVCDITAHGRFSAGHHGRLTDGEIQALSGLMDTTGFPEGAPVQTGVPFTEISAGMYAAAAIAAALFARGSGSPIQHIDISLYACALNGLTTFLPKAFSRTRAKRVGNRHTSAAPWNSYRTRDGWILICTSTEEQWRKVKKLAGHEELSSDRFESLAKRVANVNELDAIVEKWTTQLSTTECSNACEALGIAAGPIVSLASLIEEPNFRLRHSDVYHAIKKNGLSKDRFRDVSIFKIHTTSDASDTKSTVRPTNFDASDTKSTVRPTNSQSGPLSGINVVEIGQYTTAPLAGKHLAALGATVVKVEPPEGEISRQWSPGQHGISYFFALNNTDKGTVLLDLNKPSHRDYLQDLLTNADVLVENLRPGALSKLGFSRKVLEEINPSLVYCSISGFGIENSAYPTRPAFDTVIQAMSGIMDMTRDNNETPVKTGTSAADIFGGQSALFAIIAALVARKNVTGTFVEISMQDVAGWAAIYAAGNPRPRGTVVSCLDGHVFFESYPWDKLIEYTINQCSALTRDEALSALLAINTEAVPVLRVDELMENAEFLNEGLGAARDENGGFWPVMKLPYYFSHTPAVIRRIPGKPVHPEL